MISERLSKIRAMPIWGNHEKWGLISTEIYTLLKLRILTSKTAQNNPLVILASLLQWRVRLASL